MCDRQHPYSLKIYLNIYAIDHGGEMTSRIKKRIVGTSLKTENFGNRAKAICEGERLTAALTQSFT